MNEGNDRELMGETWKQLLLWAAIVLAAIFWGEYNGLQYARAKHCEALGGDGQYQMSDKGEIVCWKKGEK